MQDSMLAFTMPFRPIVDSETFQGAVVLGETPETRSLEFKAEYRWQKSKHKPENPVGQPEECCRDVAQFANTDGGTLLVGITERTTPDGRRIADAVRSVENIDGFKQWMEQAIRKHLTPSTFSRSLDTIVLPGGPVVAINVPPSLHLVALWYMEGKKGIEYLYRTDHGKQWMNPDEVERHIMNASRALQIELARVLDEVGEAHGNYPVELTPSLKLPMMKSSGPYASPYEVLETVAGEVFVNRGTSSDREVALHINVSSKPALVRVPHGLIQDVWTTTDGRVGLCLKVAIIVRGERDLKLEPLASILA